MTLTLKTFILSLILSILFSSNLFALEPLSQSQMKSSTAQSGMDMSIDDVIVETFVDETRLTNPDNGNFITFNNNYIFYTLSVGQIDINGDGRIDPVSLDIISVSDPASPVNGQTFVYLKAPDWDQSFSARSDSVDINGVGIGGISVSNWAIPSFEVYAGPHDSGGFDIQASFASDVDSVEYNYNTTDALSFNGIHIYNSFTGVAEDPASWVGSGQFQLGDIFSGNPMTVDIGVDTNPSWTIHRDAAQGGDYDIANPRNDSSYISVNAPMKGSIRIENVQMGGTDFGPIAIDGIDLTTFKVEFPGRGLGN